MSSLPGLGVAERDDGPAAAAVPAPVAPATLPRIGRSGSRRLRRIALLAISDALAIVLAVAIAYWLWARPVRHQAPDVYLQLLPLVPLFLLAYANLGLYPGFGLGAVETIRRLTLATSSLFVAFTAMTFALKLPPLYSRVTFVLAWCGAVVLLPLLRFVLLSAVRGRTWWGEPCVVVGSGDLAERTISALSRALSLGYRPVAQVRLFVPEEQGSATGEVPTFDGLDVLPELAAAGVQVALVAEEESPTELVADLRHRFRHLLWVRDHRDLPVEGLEVSNLGGVLAVKFVNQLLRRRNRLLKRTADLALASVGLLLAVPWIVLGAVLIRLRSRGPVFYRQTREGLDGRHFRVLKLRTMYADAEERLERYLERSPEARAEWESRLKLCHDPRVVAGVGRFVRRFSIDELPQLVNVLRGEMSLVGPRPFPEYHLRMFAPRFRDLRRRVRPGLTGLWQVMVRSEGGIEEQEAYDAYYIRNWSLGSTSTCWPRRSRPCCAGAARTEPRSYCRRLR
ncbi:MAG: exopolysaccharide biosynthesis polyprenyl glycosylphosphotransferase [Thermoanaerobaculia bacterium]